MPLSKLDFFVSLYLPAKGKLTTMSVPIGIEQIRSGQNATFRFKYCALGKQKSAELGIMDIFLYKKCAFCFSTMNFKIFQQVICL